MFARGSRGYGLALTYKGLDECEEPASMWPGFSREVRPNGMGSKLTTRSWPSMAEHLAMSTKLLGWSNRLVDNLNWWFQGRRWQSKKLRETLTVWLPETSIRPSSMTTSYYKPPPVKKSSSALISICHLRKLEAMEALQMMVQTNESFHVFYPTNQHLLLTVESQKKIRHQRKSKSFFIFCCKNGKRGVLFGTSAEIGTKQEKPYGNKPQSFLSQV